MKKFYENGSFIQNITFTTYEQAFYICTLYAVIQNKIGGKKILDANLQLR